MCKNYIIFKRYYLCVLLHKHLICFVACSVFFVFTSPAFAVTSKNTYYKQLLLQKLQENNMLSKEPSKLTVTRRLCEFKTEQPQIFSKYLKLTMEMKDTSLFNMLDYSVSDRLVYDFDCYDNNRKARIVERTLATYAPTIPKAKFSDSVKKLDFEILCGTVFGLTYFVFDEYGQVKHQGGSTNTTYYSVSHDPILQLFAIAINSTGDILLISNHNYIEQYRLSGFYATTVEFHDRKLLFASPKRYSIPENSWDKEAIFEFDPNTKKIIRLTPFQYADVRGVLKKNNQLIISNGAKGELVFYDLLSKKIHKKIIGLHYPNGLSFNEKGNILLAEEHNDRILELNLEKILSWPEQEFPLLQIFIEFSTFAKHLLDPGYAVEINKGEFRGFWLVCDTDHNRILLVEPKSWDIVFELTNVNASIKAVPIYPNDIGDYFKLNVLMHYYRLFIWKLKIWLYNISH